MEANIANIPVNFEILREHHPSYKQIKGLIGGPLLASVNKDNWETCCIQVNYALNHSGKAIQEYAFHNPDMGRTVRAVKSNDDMNYIFEVTDLKAYLNSRYGIAENYKGTQQEMINNIRVRYGILALGHRHVDLWEGERYHWQDLYLDLWKSESVKKRGIFFWEVTSKWGF
jgi:hypothetical protein